MMMDPEEYSDAESEDMAQVVELLRRLRSENVELKKNFERLKALHLQQDGSYKQLQAKYAALSEERVQREREVKETYDKWRAELEDKQRSFEAARNQILGPKDLQLMRVELLSQVEAPYKRKCDILMKEAEEAQHALVTLKRQHEEAMAGYRNMELRMQREMEVVVADHRAEVSALKDKIAALGAPQARLASLETSLKAAERDRDGHAFTITKLQDEIAVLRRQKEQATVEKESIAAKVERRVKDIQAEELKLSGLVETLTRKNRHLTRELGEAHRSGEEMFGQLMKAQGERNSMQEQLEALRKGAALEAQTAAAQYEDAIRRLEDRIEGLKDEVHSRERQVAELHIAHQEQVARLVEAHDARLSEVEREGAERAREWREQRNELQAKVETLKDACEEYRRECEEFKRKEGARAEAARREAERLTAAASEAERQLAGRTQELGELRADHDALRADAQRLELANGHLSRRKEELEAQVERLQEEAREGAAVRAGLAKELEEARAALGAERAAQLSALDAARQAAALEKAALARKYQTTLKELNAQHESELKRARRKLKVAAGEVAQLTDEVTDLRFRSHELEAVAGAVGTTPGALLLGATALRPTHHQPTSDILAPRDVGPGLGTGSSTAGGGTGGSSRGGAGLPSTSAGTAGGTGVGRGVPGTVLADMAALKARQDEYLQAATGAGGGSGSRGSDLPPPRSLAAGTRQAGGTGTAGLSGGR